MSNPFDVEKDFEKLIEETPIPASSVCTGVRMVGRFTVRQWYTHSAWRQYSVTVDEIEYIDGRMKIPKHYGKPILPSRVRMDFKTMEEAESVYNNDAIVLLAK